MKKKLLSMGLALIMCICLSACSANTETNSEPSNSTISQEETQTTSDVQYIQQKGTLVVGMTDFAPMDYKDENGEWIGFDADMARKVAEALGVQIQFVPIEWGNKLMELDNKSVDCLWNGMTITDEITSGASATVPYAMNAQVVVLTKEKAQQYEQGTLQLEDLAFVVEEGSAGQTALDEKELSYLTVSAQTDALMEVAAGTSDACVIDLLMAGATIGEGTDYENLTYVEKLTEEEYGVGVRKGSDLADFINEQFQKLYQDGTMKTLAEKYGISENLIAQE